MFRIVIYKVLISVLLNYKHVLLLTLIQPCMPAFSHHNEHQYNSSYPAKLSIQGVSVTINFNKHQLQVYTKPPYIQYLQDRFHWNTDLTLSISWTVLQWGLC